ncbi:tRNA (N6-threonylcarbamoyladenosine(37)-N6)-methyltransferase TrmO [Chloroflexota bacterium]
MAGYPFDITLKPIGTVKSEITQPLRRDFKDIISEIIIDDSLTEALDNLDEFSHIIVLYWMHRSSGQPPKKVRPMGKPGLPLVGLFASRAPHRPNPIGKTTVRLLKRESNVLKVKGLDAIDGTPVIDIKPYIPGYESVTRARVPPWVVKR